MEKTQRGFSAVEFLLIIVVAGLIVGAGWYVYNKNSKNKEPVDAQNSSVQDSDTANTNTTTDSELVSYNDPQLGLSFEYPKSWGDVEVVTHARNANEAFEPVKSYYINFSNLPKFYVVISPDTWQFTGGESEWDFPETDDTFAQARNDAAALQIMNNETTYLQMKWTGIDNAVVLRGAKKLNLSKVPASYVEVVWASVSDNCAQAQNDGTKKPQTSCYGEDLVAETQQVLESFKTN